MMTKPALDRVLKDFPWLWGICHECNPARIDVVVQDACDQPSFDFLTETDFTPPTYVSPAKGVDPIEEVWLHYTIGCIERVVRVSGKGKPWPDCSAVTVEKAIFDDLPLGASLKHIACVCRAKSPKKKTRRVSGSGTYIDIIRPPHNEESNRRDFYEFMLENGFDLASVEKRISWQLKSLTCSSGKEVVYAMPDAESCIFIKVRQQQDDQEPTSISQIKKAICGQERIGTHNCDWYTLDTKGSLQAITMPATFFLHHLAVMQRQPISQPGFKQISESERATLIREVFKEFIR